MESVSAKPEYRYGPLEKGEIRLLELHPGAFEDVISCSLKHVKLQDATDKYEALSYAWITNDPEDQGAAPEIWIDEHGTMQLYKVQIVCSGAAKDVTMSLHGALKHLRQKTAVRTLWADALCINQDDNSERSVQVQHMGDIYESAIRVLTWLGEETPEVQGALENLPEWCKRSPPVRSDDDRATITWISGTSFSIKYEGSYPDVLSYLVYQSQNFPPILHLLTRRWWRRRWVIQEVVRAKDAVLLCGSKQHSWNILTDIDPQKDPFDGFDKVNYVKRHDEFKVIDSMVNISILNAFATQYRMGDFDLHAPFWLSVMLHTTRHFHCADPRDYLYSLLSVCRDTQRPSASLLRIDDNATIGTIAARLSEYFLRAKPYPFALFENCIGTRQMYSPDEQFSSTPSWARSFLDASYAEHRSLDNPLLPCNDIHSETKITWHFADAGRVLSVKGAIIADVVETYRDPRHCWAPFDSDKSLFNRAVSKATGTFPTGSHEQTSKYYRDLVRCGGLDEEDDGEASAVPTRPFEGLYLTDFVLFSPCGASPIANFASSPLGI